MERVRGEFPNPAGTEHSVSPLLEGYLSEQEYARQRGISIRTCQRDRALRKAPPHCILGKQIFYRIAAVREWLLAQERSFEPDRRGSATPRRRSR